MYMSNDNLGKVLIQIRDLRVGSGISTCIMNYYESIVSAGFKVDFLLNRVIESPYMEMVEKHGSQVYVLPVDTNKPSLSNAKYIEMIARKDYDIIHVNISGLNASLALHYAKKHNIKFRIYHGHSVFERGSVKAWLRSQIYVNYSISQANYYAACSKHAGKSLFKDKHFFTIHNVFDVDRFEFNQQARNRIRTELNINGKIALGSVGRLSDSKKPIMAIKIFEKLYRSNQKYVFLWVGDGELRTKVEKYIIDNNLTSRVLLLGNRNDINDIYSALDLFVLPTEFEGLGLVFLEAQAAGLECFASDCIPDDVIVTDHIHTIPLEDDIAKWAREIEKHFPYKRVSGVEKIKKAGYDKYVEESEMVKMYRMIMEGGFQSR